MRLAEAVRIARWAQGDDAGMRACCELDQACFLVDDPDGPPLAERLLRSYLEHPRDGADLVPPGGGW